MRKTLLPLALLLAGVSTAALASTDQRHPKSAHWPFDGMTGHLDRQAAQRGFQVYKEVCAACHGIKRVAFRNLADLGFSEAEIKALAATYEMTDGPNDEGEMFKRPGIPADRFPSPFPNDEAARAANNGAAPPDLSLMVKARHDGANYLYSLLTGYGEAIPTYTCTFAKQDGTCVAFAKASGGEVTEGENVPAHESASGSVNEHAEVDAPEQKTASSNESGQNAVGQNAVGQTFSCVIIRKEALADKETGRIHETCVPPSPALHYNPYFPGMQIAMPQPIAAEGQVTYADGTKASIDQMAKDVTVFLQWAAEPEMEHRKSMGIKVLLFLAVFVGVMYVAKKRVWNRLGQH